MAPPRDDRAQPAQPEDPGAYPAEKARQGTIILRHWWSRAIFIGALIAGLVMAFFFGAAH